MEFKLRLCWNVLYMNASEKFILSILVVIGLIWYISICFAHVSCQVLIWHSFWTCTQKHDLCAQSKMPMPNLQRMDHCWTSVVKYIDRKLDFNRRPIISVFIFLPMNKGWGARWTWVWRTPMGGGAYWRGMEQTPGQNAPWLETKDYQHHQAPCQWRDAREGFPPGMYNPLLHNVLLCWCGNVIGEVRSQVASLVCKIYCCIAS